MGMKIGLNALKTFYIMQILLERTDETHSLNGSDIGTILKKEYGITMDRHTLYGEIDKLSEVGLDIIKREGKTGGKKGRKRFTRAGKICYHFQVHISLPWIQAFPAGRRSLFPARKMVYPGVRPNNKF